MARIDVNFFSQTLKRTVEFVVYLPADPLDHEVDFEPPYRSLYLLHGMMGNRHEWVEKSMLVHYINNKNIAVIMPSGENSMYIDNLDTLELYSHFLGKELVQFTRKILPLSNKKKDTYIAGFSMGGYGALLNGLLYNNTFSKIGSFSAPIFDKERIESDIKNGKPFGISFKTLYQTNSKHFDLYELFSESDKGLDIFITCGKEDFLYKNNIKFVNYLEEIDVVYEYKEYEGGHDWTVWDPSIRDFLVFIDK